MPSVHLNHLSHRYSSAVDVLVDVDVHLGHGWTGVVGANGAGKTTLLHLVAHRLQPTDGSVTLDPADSLVKLCDQTVDRPNPDIEAFAGSWDGFDVSLRGRLRLEAEDFHRWATLSPGERKRWQIAAALSREPDVLLLDEPTNHLDSDAREMLITALTGFTGVGLVVSHDRRLLANLTTRTLRIDRGEVTLWNAAYEEASAGWRAVEAASREERALLRAEAKRANRHLAKLRQTNEQKRAAFKERNNTSSFKDIDSRSAARQAKHREGEKAAGKALATAARARDRATEAATASEIRREVGGAISFQFEPAPKRLLASVLGPLEVAGHTLVEHVDVKVERDDRIWLRGHNGAGKTTLLHALIQDAALPADKLLFLEQEMTPEEVDRVMTEMRSLRPDERGSVLAIVALLGVDPELLLASKDPSPGEARKLATALGLGRAAWLVVLDEPTNHLDLPSIERLQAALSGYPGALVVVTHDDEFAHSLNLQPYDLA
ncbi:MAG TPA: ATP-binding cassette domain-containing protein [Acidimicrobiia bacterium]|nr:ATP-binding cassette domain-containing protein [Acidimicrobiia bacterium]